EEANQIHLPALGDQPEEAAEDAGQQTAGHQFVFEGVSVVLPLPHAPKEAKNVEQDDQIQDSDQQQENSGDARADQPAQALQLAIAIDEVGHDELGRHA